jgi:hypothetical protein
MATEKISNREQVLIFIVAATFVGGSYGLFRVVPQLKKLAAAQEVIVKNQDKVKNPVFPEEPNEDIDDLKEKLEDVKASADSVLANLAGLEKNLAPTDSQEMVLKISEAARAAGVRIIESVPYLVQKKDGEATNQPVKSGLTKRQQRRADREARKKARKTGATAGLGNIVSGIIPKEGELIYRLVNELDSPRPFQRISVEGNFADLQKFLLSLRSLPWQATVVKIDIDVAIQTPPPGVPQPITVRMIVAM